MTLVPTVPEWTEKRPIGRFLLTTFYGKKSRKLDRFLLATFYGKRKVVDSYLTNFFHKKVVSRNWDYLTTFFV